jgi:hypothetical protein
MQTKSRDNRHRNDAEIPEEENMKLDENTGMEEFPPSLHQSKVRLEASLRQAHTHLKITLKIAFKIMLKRMTRRTFLRLGLRGCLRSLDSVRTAP